MGRIIGCLLATSFLLAKRKIEMGMLQRAMHGWYIAVQQERSANAMYRCGWWLHWCGGDKLTDTARRKANLISICFALPPLRTTTTQNCTSHRCLVRRAGGAVAM